MRREREITVTVVTVVNGQRHSEAMRRVAAILGVEAYRGGDEDLTSLTPANSPPVRQPATKSPRAKARFYFKGGAS